MHPFELPPPANDGDLPAPAYAELHALSDFSFQRGASNAACRFATASGN